MSHGKSGTHDEGTLIYTKDCQFLSSEDLLRRFNNINCPLLKGKPKIFFFQFCRWPFSIHDPLFVIYSLITPLISLTEETILILAIKVSLLFFISQVGQSPMVIQCHRHRQKSKDLTAICSLLIPPYRVTNLMPKLSLIPITYLLNSDRLCWIITGYVSYREESEGTWFIKALSLTFMRDAHECHVDRLLQIVCVRKVFKISWDITKFV